MACSALRQAPLPARGRASETTSHPSASEISSGLQCGKLNSQKQFLHADYSLKEKGTTTLISSLAKKNEEKYFMPKNVFCRQHLGFIQLFLHTKHFGLVSPLNLFLKQQERSSHTLYLRPPVHSFTNSELSG